MHLLTSKRIYPLILLLLVLSSSSCRRDLFGVEGSGPVVSETRHPGNFSGVELAIDANVILHNDSNCRVEISAQQNILGVLSTEIHGSRLSIGFHRNVADHGAITIHVYAPLYDQATISGSGSILNNTLINVHDLTAGISGSGSILLNGITGGTVNSTISGSGNISISGTASAVHSNTSGSGDTHLFDLVTGTAEVKISGSGNAEVNVIQQLQVSISGSGDVYYKGTPAVDADISGSGKLHHVN